MLSGRETLSLDGVGVRLGGFVLSGVTFAVGPGEVVGLVGHNGSGKSTTFRIIADLIRPTSGSITLGDLDHRADERAFKRRVCFVGDNNQTYAGMTVGAVLAFARRLYPNWDHDWCAQLCDELRLPLDTKVAHLSAGMRTKLGLVLGFSPRPDVIVLDEPTAGLDGASNEWIWQVVDRQSVEAGLAVIVSSHSRDDVAQHCSRVVLLEQGQIIDQIDIAGDRALARERLEGAMGRGGGHAR
ncbi:MAG: ABC transporter ATP-binding protein [Actinomycetales bacterium]|jgi:ABC-2 type transport system ATP-binding protein|uniref:ABC transporter ATP-binding protein n=1 Tax=Candidatus Phosphoribacter hodrii TaxID=2953743 RepID=A0A935CEE1_9MICO|nr:ABC transporter ATP-binding protein [Candidatus Phosphoribacter hodrii]HOV01558.1 ABC transporter ATP-binding protein [Dermatophilaceae bacterium]MBK7272071.1 ABC transporter ATP-binding protein [Candidatus Phosphoribacter hodrii]HPV79302.1 ABC transporter ATP-binding protein [Dermatophilaceae bacterium]HQG11333.1 ABC transporter ATP-binding protein [Dermatophilaceae bacterium]